MKAKKIVIGSIIATLILIATASGSFYAGTKFEKSETNKENNRTQTVQKIAVVNLDEGVQEEDTIRFYSNELIKNEGLEYVPATLNEAQSGIATGDYGAYIIIPATFSESVRSVDGIQSRAELLYDINPYLDSDTRMLVSQMVCKMFEDVSDNISFTYISSIMGEFHEVQDNVSTIMANDNEELENINQIEPSNIAGKLAWSELEYNSNILENVDYNDISQTIQDETGSLISECSEGMKNAKDALGKEAQKGIDELNCVANALKEIEEEDILKENNKYVYEDGIKKLTEKYEVEKTAQERENSMTKRIKEEYTVLKSGDQKYVDNELAQIQQSNQQMVDKVLEDSQKKYEALLLTISSSSDYQDLKNRISAMPRDLFSDQEKQDYALKTAVNCAKKTKDVNSNVWIDLRKADPDLDAILPNAPENPNEDRIYKVDDIELTEELKEAIKDVYADSDVLTAIIKEDIIDVTAKRINEYTENYKNECIVGAETVEKTKTAFQKFDVGEYWSEETAQIRYNAIQTSIRQLEERVNQQTGNYREYVDETIQIADKNISTLQADIKSANDVTLTNLTSTISDLKDSRTKKNSINVSLLQDFSERLPYTRVGNLDDFTTYEFIAAPTVLERTDTGIKTNDYIRKNYDFVIFAVFVSSIGGATVIYAIWTVLSLKKKRQ